MKIRTAALKFILCLAGFFAVPAATRVDVNCSGMTLTGIIDGNVIVPNGGSCTIGNSYGMLQVDLVHEVPEAAKPRKVTIGASEPAQPQVTEQRAAA